MEWSFNVVNQVEEVYAGLLQKTLNALKANEEVSKTDYYVCKVCGNTLENGVPFRSPICGASRAQFLKVT